MKIEPVRGNSATVRSARITRVGGAEKRSARVGGAATESPAPHAITDNVEILGVPEAELTPKVRAALMSLMADVADLRREISETRERLAHVERMADQDGLVPTANRRAFVRELSRAIAATERYGAKAAVVYFDINGFKEINDTLGHAAGDAALHHVAGVLLTSVRESDTVGRLGGDEFGVILSHSEEYETTEKAEALVNNIRSTPFEWEGKPVPIHVAFGAYTFRPGEDADQALAAADQAMYEHKREMKNGN